MTRVTVDGTVAAGETKPIDLAGLFPPQSIGVTPTNPSISVGSTQQFTATGSFTNESSLDITARAIWSNSNPAVATLDEAGLATAISPGVTTISAYVDLYFPLNRLT